MDKKIELSIGILISNRMDTVPRCLDSLKPILESIPSELILVDTSQNEEINKICLQHSSNVMKFTWCKDFAKARNECLKRAKGEWFMFLDDDEWFDDPDELVHFFQSDEYKEYGYANYIIRNYTDAEYIYYSDTWATRLIRLTPETEFRSKIHEYLYPIFGKEKRLHTIVHHSGYIFETEEKRKEHFDRNVSLLLDMVAEEPNEMRWMIQLAQEYNAQKEWKRLLEYCIERIEATKDYSSGRACINIGTFYIGKIIALMRLNKFDEAEITCRELTEDERNTRLCRAYCYLFEAEIAYKNSDFQNTIWKVECYLKEKEFFEKKENEQTYSEQRMALLVDEAFDVSRIQKAYTLFICSNLKLGKIEALEQYFDCLGWDNSTIYVYKGTEIILVEAMSQLEYHEIFVKVLECIFRNAELRKSVIKQIVDLKECDYDGYRKVCEYLPIMSYESSFHCIENMLENKFEPEKISFSKWQAYMDEWVPYLSKKDLMRLKESLKEEKERWRIWDNYLDICVEKRNAVTDEEKNTFYKNVITFYQKILRVESLKQHSTMLPELCVEALKAQGICCKEEDSDDDWNRKMFLYLQSQYNLQTEYSGTDIREIEQLFFDYAEATISFSTDIYQKEVLEKNRSVTSETVQVAFLIKDALNCEMMAEKIQILKECIWLMPEISNNIRKYVMLLQENALAPAISTEMKELQNQMKPSINQLMNSRCYEEVKQVLSQIRSITSLDEELENIWNQLK